MKRVVDQPAADDGDHFIYRVGELIAPILDMDCRLSMSEILAVNV
jgi:hypothetical protein